MDNNTYLEYTLCEFSDELFSSAPAPGGGGASALIGALAASLSGMVCSLTSGKKTYAMYQEDISRIADKASKLKQDLLNMIDEDAKSFLPLSKAYSLPKDTPEQKKRRDEVMQECLKTACQTPVNIIKAAHEVSVINEELCAKGSRLAVSDAGCAAAAARAAATGAWLNVVINLNLIKDDEYVKYVNQNIKPIVDSTVMICDRTYEEVLKILKGEK